MSNEVQWKYHPKNPANQPFNGKGRRNLTKKDSWWNAASGKYWRNAQKAKTKPAEKAQENA